MSAQSPEKTLLPDKTPTPEKTWQENVPSDTKGLSRFGYVFLLLTFGIFLVWANWAPISGAVATSGKVAVEGQNQLIQHPFGGVVKKIFAKEGDLLQKGDVLAVIEPENAIATLKELNARKDYLIASRSRLVSVKGGDLAEYLTLNEKIDLGQLRGVSSQIKVEKTASSLISDEQNAVLAAGNTKYESELSALQNRLNSLQSQQTGIADQITQNDALAMTLADRYNKLSSLAASGDIAENQVWQTQTQKLEIASRISALNGEFNSLDGQIKESQDRLKTLSASRQQENSRELSDVLVELESIEERISAAKNAYSYSELTAPETGIVTNLSVNTVGGVVRAGVTIAEIVPQNENLLIETRITPEDIKSVSVGSVANVTITAFNARTVEPFEGTVSYVSADSQVDENTGAPYFLARIIFDKTMKKQSDIKPGMYAQVFIGTEARTFMSYVLRPITDSFQKAFNES